jgi:hypothetical protein
MLGWMRLRDRVGASTLVSAVGNPSPMNGKEMPLQTPPLFRRQFFNGGQDT